MKKMLLVVLMGCLGTFTARASVVLEPTDDAFVDSQSPDTNYGSETYVRAYRGEYLYKAYIRFDASGMGPVVDIASIEALNLYNGTAERPGIVYVVTNGADDVWTEDTITWNMVSTQVGTDHTLPAGVGVRIGAFDAPPENTTGNTVQFSYIDDLSKNILLEELNSGDRQVTLVISTTSAQVIYASKENTDVGAHPVRMILETATAILEPTDDASVDSHYPDTNYGSDTDVKTYRDEYGPRKVYVRFDASGLGTVTNISAIDAVNLYNGTAERPGIVFLVTNGTDDVWTEDTITWNMVADEAGTDHLLPAGVGVRIGAFDAPPENTTGNTVQFTYIDENYEDLLIDALNSGDRRLTLVISTTSAQAIYASKENTQAGMRPVRMAVESVVAWPATVILFADAGGVTVSVNDLPGHTSVTNTLQMKTDLTSGVWSNLYSVTGTTGTNWVFASDLEQCFFRIQSTQ